MLTALRNAEILRDSEMENGERWNNERTVVRHSAGILICSREPPAGVYEDCSYRSLDLGKHEWCMAKHGAGLSRRRFYQ